MKCVPGSASRLTILRAEHSREERSDKDNDAATAGTRLQATGASGRPGATRLVPDMDDRSISAYP